MASSPHYFVVHRTVEVAPRFTVELRVSRSPTLGWAPHHARDAAALRASAEERAAKHACFVLKVIGVEPGWWRFPWTATGPLIERFRSPPP